ncbi:hypothetical protein MP228_012864 [Amoeboaphelidium protococcarum]|nr:hypothetical protein MP228_012864 [Amoeboaphelidium protococcarum]
MAHFVDEEEIKLPSSETVIQQDIGLIAPNLFKMCPLYFDMSRSVVEINHKALKLQQSKDAGTDKNKESQIDQALDSLLQTTESPSKALERQQEAAKQKQSKKRMGASDAGSDWYHMPRTEITPEIEQDLRLIQMRNVLDPKRFYKKDNSILQGALAKGANKKAGGNKKGQVKSAFFQIGTVLGGTGVDTAINNADSVKGARNGGGIVEALLQDERSREYYKRKFDAVREKKERINNSGYNAVKKRRFGGTQTMNSKRKSNR